VLPFAGLIGGLAATALVLPLAWKWQLGLRRVGAGMVAIALLAGVLALGFGEALDLPAAARAAVGAAITLLVALAVLAYRFYRDPNRTPPPGENLIVSPADGEVLYVKRSREGQIPVASKHGRHARLEELTRTALHGGDALVVGIGMSFLDVHVNRAPIAGRVLSRSHFPGRFGSLRQPEMVFENERATTVIGGSEIEVAIVQIASRLVRQIAGYVREGDEVTLGERIGVIRLGSQVDLVLPRCPELRVVASPGDQVQAGTTVLATFAPDLREPGSPRSGVVRAATEAARG
jgi:phosphatidylserine decarboxylase